MSECGRPIKPLWSSFCWFEMLLTARLDPIHSSVESSVQNLPHWHQRELKTMSPQFCPRPLIWSSYWIKSLLPRAHAQCMKHILFTNWGTAEEGKSSRSGQSSVMKEKHVELITLNRSLLLRFQFFFLMICTSWYWNLNWENDCGTK